MNKNLIATVALFFGTIGLHKFLLGKPIQGLMYILFSWTGIPTLLGVLESLYYFCISQESFDRQYFPEKANYSNNPPEEVTVNGKKYREVSDNQ